MAVAITVQKYLASLGIKYDTVTHRPTHSSNETVQSSHIDGSQLAKGVVLRAGDEYVLAVLPASHHVRMGQLKAYLGKATGLATEEEIERLFADCDTGAVPALGNAYGLEVIMDDSLADLSDLFFEGGDHGTLVHLTADGFHKAMAEARHAAFSAPGPSFANLRQSELSGPHM